MKLGKRTSSSTPAGGETPERPSHPEASKVGHASELDGGTFGRARPAGWAEGEAGANATIKWSMHESNQYRVAWTMPPETVDYAPQGRLGALVAS